MEITLKVKNKDDEDIDFKPIQLQMSTIVSNIYELPADIVYEDREYIFRISSNLIKSIEDDISIYINNNELNIDKNTIKQVSDNTFEFQLENKKPFNLIYGITDIIVATETKVFYSNPIVIAVKDFNDNEISLKKMIEEILSSERTFLNTKDYLKISPQKTSLHKNINLKEEIILLKNIINAYNQMYYSFSINPCTKNSYAYIVDKTEKLNSLNYKTIQSIANNPQELRYHNIPTGMFFNKMPIAPEKTLIKNTIKDINTYENQQIVGFIETIYRHVDARIKEIEDKEEVKNTIKLKDSNIKHSYKLSSQIINLFSSASIIDNKKDLLKIRQDIISIKNRYKKCISVSANPINIMPKPTPIFMEIVHYRQIFLVIKEWFSVEKIKITDPNLILNFPSADTIFELYTIVNIFNSIYDMGYKEKQRKKYDYKIKHINDTKFENTFEFTKDNTVITLYYQPVIHSDTDNIGLCRIDPYTRSKYYQPDFIIKKEKDNNIEYSILDAKWSPINNLLPKKNNREKNYRVFEECIYKYYFSILRTDNQQPVSYLWLINGKNNRNDKTIYYHWNNKNFNVNSKIKNRAGIVTLTPDCDKNDFRRIIQNILED